MKYIHIVAFLLLVVGGLNWLAVGFGYNVVEMLLGMGSAANAVYMLVGAAAVYEIIMHKSTCKMCGGSSM